LPIISVNGGFGSGKTLMLTMLGYDYLKKEKVKVYSNYHLTYNYLPLTLDFILDAVINNVELHDAILLGDEIYTWLESRDSGSDVNKIFSYFIMQSRKRNVTIAYSAQLDSMVDKRLRLLASLKIECFKDFENNTINYIFLSSGNVPFSCSIPLDFFVVNRIFDMYDTSEIIDIQAKVHSKENLVKDSYSSFKDNPIFQEINQMEAVTLIKHKYPILNEADCRMVYKMLNNPKLANEILKT